MPVPIRCLDEDVSHVEERFRKLLSKPQYEYFVTVVPVCLAMSVASRGSTSAVDTTDADPVSSAF